MAMNKQEVEQMCEDIANEINKLIADMSDEDAQAALDNISESFFHLGDNRADH
jgi:hypothetical protein